MRKRIKLPSGAPCLVELKKEAYEWIVKVGGKEYYRSPRELFAVQVFVSI